MVGVMPSWLDTLTSLSAHWWDIRAEADNAVRIDIIGPIGYSWDDDGVEEGVEAASFVSRLNGLKGVSRLDVHMSSPGGSAQTGVVIYNNLRRHPARVRMVVDGLAASAASIIAMAGDEIVMSPGSMMMIHNARGSIFGGTADEFQTMAGVLEKTNVSMAEIYAARAGGTGKGWLKAMARESWYTASEAVEAGLADQVDGEEVDTADLDAVAEWGQRAYGWSHAGRAHAPAPEPVTAEPDWQAELAALSPCDHIAALATLAANREDG
jgi:ATP-dependent protease ClpP protease subunit